jgi:hypothetical protein
MNRLDIARVKQAFVDVGAHDVALGKPQVAQLDGLSREIAALLSTGPGYCVCYGTNKVLARHGLDIREDREVAYGLLETLFRNAMTLIDLERYSVVPHAMSLSTMDVDGFNLNQNFSHDGSVQSRAFMTSKCIHFDAATPFIANIYGPNENIGGGHPLICDVRQYCRDHNADPRDLVDNIPNNYNIVLKESVYAVLKNDYSFALDVDIDSDIVGIMLLNEINFGIAHGATAPYKLIPAAPSKRPIRHIEYQFSEEPHYTDWFAFYGLPMNPAFDYAGENLSLDYYQPAPEPFDRLVPVNKAPSPARRAVGV